MPVAHLPVFEYVRYVLPQSKLNRSSRPLLSWCFRPLLVKRCYCSSLLRELSHGGKWIFLVLFALQSKPGKSLQKSRGCQDHIALE